MLLLGFGEPVSSEESSVGYAITAVTASLDP